MDSISGQSRITVVIVEPAAAPVCLPESSYGGSIIRSAAAEGGNKFMSGNIARLVVLLQLQ